MIEHLLCGIAAAGTASAAQAFSFNSLAQAAGLTLRPMPRGVTNLEEIEKLQSGNLENNHHINVSLAHIDPHTGNLAAHPQPAVAETPQAAAPEVSTTPAMQSPFAAHAGDQTQQQADTGRTLFDTLSGGGATAGMPPPGFAVSKAPSAISWGSCNHLQGIWGAPTSTPGFTGQPDWGPPASANLASFPSQNPLSPSAAASANVQPAANQLLQLRQQHVQQQAAAPQLDQRLLFPPRETPPPIAHNPAAPFTSQLDQLSRAQQAQQALAALTNRDPGAAQLPHQDGNVNRAVDAAQNPLLALLGRHNASATTGENALPASCSHTAVQLTYVTSVAEERVPFHIIPISRC